MTCCCMPTALFRAVIVHWPAGAVKQHVGRLDSQHKAKRTSDCMSSLQATIARRFYAFMSDFETLVRSRVNCLHLTVERSHGTKHLMMQRRPKQTFHSRKFGSREITNAARFDELGQFPDAE